MIKFLHWTSEEVKLSYFVKYLESSRQEMAAILNLVVLKPGLSDWSFGDYGDVWERACLSVSFLPPFEVIPKDVPQVG